MTDVFLICFAAGGEGAAASVVNIESKWLPEIKHCANDFSQFFEHSYDELLDFGETPAIYLVGMKNDIAEEAVVAQGALLPLSHLFL